MLGSKSNDCHGNVRAIARREFLLRSARWSAGLIGACLIACGAYGVYGIWRDKHLERQAIEFAARGDVKSAVLVARHLLQINNHNLIGLHVMADLAEGSRRPEAIEWRKAIAALQPNGDNQFALANTALQFGSVELASRTLKRVDPAVHDTVRFHQLAGTVALAEHKLDAAEKHFAAAQEKEPTNRQTALNLATIRLTSSKPETVDRARETLCRLSEEADVRVPALRALAGDALGHRDETRAEHWTALLVQEKSAAFADHLLRLEATERTELAAAAMADCRRLAADNPGFAIELITWMNRHDLAHEAFAWSSSLDEQTRHAHSVPLAIAESLSCMCDWPALLKFVRGANWGEQEALRLAVESHAIRHTNSTEQSSAEAGAAWQAALTAARGHIDQVASIARLAQGWGYQAQAADAWWTIANANTKAKEALAALQQLYKTARDSRGLLRVAKRALELNPDDLVAGNNCASLGLLLNSDNSARRLAEKLHVEHPNDAVLAATYAFALHTEGKTSEALKILDAIDEIQLRQPALAAYYVVILVENGNVERAREFLPAARRAVLLPEEQQLLTSALRKLVVADAKAVANS